MLNISGPSYQFNERNDAYLPLNQDPLLCELKYWETPNKQHAVPEAMAVPINMG